MPGANVNVETAAPELLFHNDIPVLRTSLARHGLVDLSVPPTPRTLRVEVRPFSFWVPSVNTAIYEPPRVFLNSSAKSCNIPAGEYVPPRYISIW